jgi:RNA polymerase sigma-70 factor (ECF subfamily)
VGGLADAFGRARESGDAGGSGARPATDGDPAGLEAALALLCARGRAAYRELSLGDEDFVKHLAQCDVSPMGAANAIQVEDLFLACACLHGVPGAVARLQEVHRPVIERHARMGRPSEFVDEVAQRLWDSLLVGGDTGPRLATYTGAGPLGRWIGISAQRIALMILRHEKADERARDEVAAQEGLVAVDPELEAIKDRYRAPFQRALEAALGTLDPRAKMIYRMHLVEGLSLERIGKAYRVHQSTVSRWLAEARQRVLAEAKRRLREDLDVAPNEFESLARILVSQLDLSLSQALGKSA